MAPSAAKKCCHRMLGRFEHIAGNDDRTVAVLRNGHQRLALVALLGR